jgi:deoxyribose-phosphate aldolase
MSPNLIQFSHPSLAEDFEAQLAQKIERLIDSTLLSPNASNTDIKKLCEDAVFFNFRSVCVSPSFVSLAATYLNESSVLVCTVVGFPSGQHTTYTKAKETEDAIRNGADEIDFVQNCTWVNEKKWESISSEAKQIVSCAQGRLVKVILETSLLSETEILESGAKNLIAGAAVVKTSTGFGSRGASKKDIEILKAATDLARRHTGLCYGIKASGKVKDASFARELVTLGATRLGTSSGAAILSGLLSSNDKSEAY